MTSTCLLVMRPPVHRRQDSYSGDVTEHGISTVRETGQTFVAVEVGRNHSNKDRYAKHSGSEGFRLFGKYSKQQPKEGKTARI